MRIFKKEFKEELTNNMSIGECIITKINDSQYGNFIVHQKVNNESFPYLGLFPLLEDAVKFVKSIETNNEKYEYYIQSQSYLKEGLDSGVFEVMGQLGWELCGIDSNAKDEHGNSMYIYKRVIPIKSIIKDNSYTPWNSTIDDIELRNTIKPNVLDFEYTTKDEYTTEISINFGKNGLGLTTELIIIGEKINELSKDGLIYIKDAFIDICDDVYNLTFTYKPIK